MPLWFWVLSFWKRGKVAGNVVTTSTDSCKQEPQKFQSPVRQLGLTFLKSVGDQKSTSLLATNSGIAYRRPCDAREFPSTPNMLIACTWCPSALMNIQKTALDFGKLSDPTRLSLFRSTPVDTVELTTPWNATEDWWLIKNAVYSIVLASCCWPITLR